MNDCWVVSAVTILANTDCALIRKMFVDEQVQESGKYTMRIYFHGEQKTVVLDDYFPCYTYTVIRFSALAQPAVLQIPD